MLSEIKQLIEEKTQNADIADTLIYVCGAGSTISGTSDETSDLDFRTIALLNPNYYIGLSRFEHDKLVSGEKRINGFGDFDVEIYSPLRFLRDAYYGEIIPFEMLHVDDRFKLYTDNTILSPLFENRGIFISKSLVRRYMALVAGCYNRSLVLLEHLKRPDKIERVKTYGYETKEAMNAIKNAQIVLEILEGKTPTLYRENRDELLSIKKGKYTKSEYLEIITDMRALLEEKLKSSTSLPDVADFDKVNSFAKKYTLFLYEHVRIM